MTTVKTREVVTNSATPSPVSGNRRDQVHSARAAYSTNHVKFMAPPEWRPSIPIENAGSSKQNGRSSAGNNERMSQTTRSPEHQTWRGQRKIPCSTKTRPTIFDHIKPVVCGFHPTRAPMGINSSPNSLRQDKICQIGLDCLRIKPINNIFSKMPSQV